MKRQSTAGRPEYSNTAEAPEKDLKNSFMKIIEVLKEEMKKVLKEIKDKTINKLEGINESLKKWQERTNRSRTGKQKQKQ